MLETQRRRGGIRLKKERNGRYWIESSKVCSLF